MDQSHENAGRVTVVRGLCGTHLNTCPTMAAVTGVYIHGCTNDRVLVNVCHKIMASSYMLPQSTSQTDRVSLEVC